MTLEIDQDLVQVVEFQHVKPGKGMAAFTPPPKHRKQQPSVPAAYQHWTSRR
jgi:hypothetical protein